MRRSPRIILIILVRHFAKTHPWLSTPWTSTRTAVSTHLLSSIRTERKERGYHLSVVRTCSNRSRQTTDNQRAVPTDKPRANECDDRPTHSVHTPRLTSLSSSCLMMIRAWYDSPSSPLALSVLLIVVDRVFHWCIPLIRYCCISCYD